MAFTCALGLHASSNVAFRCCSLQCARRLADTIANPHSGGGSHGRLRPLLLDAAAACSAADALPFGAAGGKAASLAPRAGPADSISPSCPFWPSPGASQVTSKWSKAHRSAVLRPGPEPWATGPVMQGSASKRSSEGVVPFRDASVRHCRENVTRSSWRGSGCEMSVTIEGDAPRAAAGQRRERPRWLRRAE